MTELDTEHGEVHEEEQVTSKEEEEEEEEEEVMEEEDNAEEAGNQQETVSNDDIEYCVIVHVRRRWGIQLVGITMLVYGVFFFLVQRN